MEIIQTHMDRSNNHTPNKQENLVTDIEIGETPRTAQISSFVAYTKKLQFLGRPKTLLGLNCQGKHSKKALFQPDIGPKSAYLREMSKKESQPNEEFISSSERVDSNDKNEQEMFDQQLIKASKKKRMTMGKNTRMDNQLSKAVFAEKDEKEAMDRGSPHPRISSPDNVSLSPIHSNKLIGIGSQFKTSSFRTNRVPKNS